MWKSWHQRFQSTLRYKLLALVLLPLQASMAATLGYTLYWFYTYTQESLNVTLRDHLAVGRQALRDLQDERQLELQQVAESPEFRALLQRQDRRGIQQTLQRLRETKGFAFLHVTGVAGNWLYEQTDAQRASKPSGLTDRAARGFAGAALEVFREEELQRESAALRDQAHVEWREDDGHESRGLVLRLTQPISDEHGRVSMMLDGGILLNRNHPLLGAISNRVFAPGSLPAGAEPIISLLLEDTRIAAAGRGGTLIGTRLPAALRPRLQQKSDILTEREKIRGASYVSAYAPFYDTNNQPIGMLQVGVLESAFRAGYIRSASLLLALFVVAAAVAAWIAVRGVHSVLRPIETMTRVVRATRAGQDRRIGPIDTRDEIAELARQFDTMLDQLTARNREIQRAAAALEVKVTERTQELAQKNAELQETISLLEKAQEQLVLADKLSALGQMAAGIAHEINNPAAVILGNLDVLSAELGAAAQPVAREIELIAQQVERIRHIVTSLLQFARARPGTGQITEVSVNQLVQDVLPLVAHVLKTKAINLNWRFGASGSVLINVFDIEQVLINLIVNAANACERGGTIEITTADWNQGALITVQDNGCGVPPDELRRIFDPFFTTDPRRGAGLGLSVSYGLVRRYGGHITVESVVGAGSAFHIWLLREPLITEESAGTRAGTTTTGTEATYG